MNKLRHIVCAVIAFACAAAYADIPAGYYTSIDGKKDAELKTAVYQVIHNLTRISSYNDLPKYFQVTDVYPDGSNQWWDMYSSMPLYAPNFWGLNREHSFPKSWWGGLTDVNAYVDLNHLYPSEAKANQAKSNYPLGTVNTAYSTNFDNGVTLVGYPVAGQGGGAKFVFEPADEYKGDFARTYFYMVTCYQDYTWNRSYMWMLQQNTYPTLTDWAIDLLLEWSRNDPVSEKEINRNEAVYRFQNNRNPFIDFPMLAEYIWGSHKGDPFRLADADTPVLGGDPTLITPTQDLACDFGQVAIGRSVTAKVFFHGENIKGDISVRIYRDNAEYFTTPVTKIPASLVNSADGYWLTITYTPQETGRHTARLLISDGGLPGSRGMELIGECLDAPTLSPCTALAPADVTADSYLARWTTPDDVVDYFVVTRTRYVNGEAFAEELEAESNELLIEGFADSDSETYSVRSVRLGYYSDPSNVIFVDHSGIAGAEVDQPLSVTAVEGGLRLRCSSPQTGCRIYDASGRQVAFMSQIPTVVDVDLPAGLYVVTTDQSRAAKAVIVK